MASLLFLLHTCRDLAFDAGSLRIIPKQTTKQNLMFILVINQLDAQNVFFNKFISCLYMFRASCAHRQEVKNCIIQPLVSSHL